MAGFAVSTNGRFWVSTEGVIRDGTVYRDLGSDYFDTLNPTRLKRKLVKRLEGLGFHVTLDPHALPA